MTFYHAIVYGIIQGISEFLPVSSSAHLALFPYFGNFPDPGAIFDLFIHLGTAMAVIIFFRKDFALLIPHLKTAIFTSRPSELKGEARVTRHLVVALFGTAALLVLLFPVHKIWGRNYMLMSFCLSFFGLLLYLFDRYSQSQSKTFENGISFQSSLMIGFAQALAIFPGVSRSGITITCARLLGISREHASRFSFLLSLPLILLGAVAEIPAILRDPVFDQSMLLNIAVGVLTAFFTGYLTIAFFMKFLVKISFAYFMYYRFLLAGLIYYFISA